MISQDLVNLIIALFTAVVVAWNTYQQHKVIVPIIEKIAPLADANIIINKNGKKAV